MELCNGNCGLICDDSDEEGDSSPTNSPVPPRRIVPSPPLPPRRPSPSPTPNNHLRNGRHLTVPKENAPPPPSSTVILNYSDTQQNNKVLAVNTDARYDMLHRASSPSPAPAPPIPPASSAAIARAIASRHHGNHTCSTPQRQPQPPPTLPEKPCRTITATANQTSTTGQTGSNNGPPVPPPSSAPRPPKSGKEGARQDHHYENTIMICGTSQHVAKNVNLEANKARLTALMRAKDDPGSGGCAATKPESAAYENVNIEHITCLTALGFAQDAVIRALGITRNDLEMARDILHEFATKSS